MTTRTHNGFSAEAWAIYSDAVQQLDRCREQHHATYDALRAVERVLGPAPCPCACQAFQHEVSAALAIVRAALESE